MISIRNISKSYSSKQVLDKVSIEIQEGSVLSLLGPSGCGKSTLLRIIMALIKQDSGSVFVNEEEVIKPNILQIRRRIGYVIQKGGLFPHLTARENCALTAQFLGWEREAIEERMLQLANLVKIEPGLLNRLPSKLSGGQQQRIRAC